DLGPANDHRDPLVELHATGFGFVQNEAFKWIDVARPRRLSQHLRRVCVARFPTEPNSAGTEVDILRMILAGQWRGGETHNKQPSPAAITPPSIPTPPLFPFFSPPF